MIDHILGRPSPVVRRTQIFLVLFFFIWRLYKGDGSILSGARTSSAIQAVSNTRLGGKRKLVGNRSLLLRLWISVVGKRRGLGWMGRVNQRLKHFSPYQLILGTLTVMYAFRHVDDLFGLGAPEPLARLYSRSYYRATYINTAFDAGFASAMTIRPKWLKDILSVLFSGYYLVWATEGDAVLRRFRALCTVEMLRVTWEKTNNPYVSRAAYRSDRRLKLSQIRIFTALHRPSLPMVRHFLIPRPTSSSRSSLPPVKAMLFFAGTEAQLAKATQLVVDFPGGGFIAMGPECHEERLRNWAKRTGKPILGIDYGKAPEYPYPWAIEEGFDAYRTLMETKGRDIGIASNKLSVVLTGDSAGGNICATIMLRIIEHHTSIPRPVSMILAYPALDFNFTSWMSPANLRVLRTEQSETNIPGLVHGKDHMRHKSPLSVVEDVDVKNRRRHRQKSWGNTLHLKNFISPSEEKTAAFSPSSAKGTWKSLPRTMSTRIAGWMPGMDDKEESEVSEVSDSEDEDDKGDDRRREADKSLKERVKTPMEEARINFASIPRSVSPEPMGGVALPEKKKKKRAPIGTRLTMTSRVGYFQDRIISPSMMRAMAILYIGPRNSPDFETDYYISPILSPPHLLAHFPPVYLICGEKDPFVDDTVIFAGKIREAKRARLVEAETLAKGKSAKFGESLRMSTGTGSGKEEADPILSQSDDDWVQMRIIEGWGHGFMQMSSIMKEVDPVLIEMADWIDESFERADRVFEDIPTLVVAPPTTFVKPVNEYKKTVDESTLGGSDLGGFGSDDDGVVSFTPKNKRKTPPPSHFTPVARRQSREGLALDLPRSSSAPRFDLDETGSSGEVMMVKTPPLAMRNLPSNSVVPKGSATFAFFGSSKASPIRKAAAKPLSNLYGAPSERRGSNEGAAPPMIPTNSLVAAVVGGARAATPVFAAAGLAPQLVGNVTEAELMRRRRMEAVFGMGETDSAMVSDAEDDD
ncbi:hormone-sensitive lipase, partial [Tremellales sp. Uapishka_1]